MLDEIGRGEDAIATFRGAIKVRPAEARNIGCLGTILLARHQREEGLKTLDQAIAAARETIGRRPGDAGEHHILGHLLSVRGDPDGAIAAYREALRIEPGHTGSLTNLVTILRNRGDQDGIIAVLRAAIRAGPDHAWSHEALSAALQAKGDRDGAMAEIREAIRLNPDEPGYRVATLHFAQVAEGLDDAVAVTPASIGIETDDYTKHNAHGTNLYGERDHQGVLAAFRPPSGSSR